MRISDLLKQPHPANDDLRVYFRSISAIALMVLFTLFIMRPFGLSNIRSERDLFLIALAYSGTGFVVMLANSLWMIAFPQVFRQERWTVGKEILFVLSQWLTISTAIWLTNLWLNRHDANLVISSLAKSILLAGASGMLPYFLVMTLRYFYLLKKNLRNVELLNETLASRPAHGTVYENAHDAPIKVNDPKIPAISAHEFLFLESRGNYLHLFCEKTGIITAYKVRNTVKEFRETNNHIPTIFHCHRAYLINIARILHIEGNAAGYLIELHPEVKKVPVSRSRINEFNHALKTIKAHRETG